MRQLSNASMSQPTDIKTFSTMGTIVENNSNNYNDYESKFSHEFLLPIHEKSGISQSSENDSIPLSQSNTAFSRVSSNNSGSGSARSTGNISTIDAPEKLLRGKLRPDLSVQTNINDSIKSIMTLLDDDEKVAYCHAAVVAAVVDIVCLFIYVLLSFSFFF